jgi:peptidoglycan/xylan/chitin deacetylase (PgdA/CDA1 family)
MSILVPVKRTSLFAAIALALSTALVAPLGATSLATSAAPLRGVAFTFDDGLSARGIREILAVAVAERVPVTFFPTANSLRKFPQLWREIAAAGFAIGNHTAGHRSLPRLYADGGRKAVVSAIRDWQFQARATGIQTIPILRPPYGERSAVTDAIAASVGIDHVVNWSATFADTAPRCSGTIARRFAHATRGGEGTIVLGHTGAKGRAYEPLTARLFAQVIRSYQTRGITPVSLDVMFGARKRTIDWTLAAAATSAPSQIGGPRVPTTTPTPYRAGDMHLSPGEVAGVCD